jgi:hypothetical protein
MANDKLHENKPYPMLHSNTWPDFKIKIRAKLRAEGYWDIVVGKELCPEEGATKESKKIYLDWKKADQKALGIITERIGDELDQSPHDAESSFECYEMLEKTYERTGGSLLIKRIQTFYGMGPNEKEDMTEHVARFKKNLKDLENTGEKIPLSHQVAVLLKSTSIKYSTIQAIIESRFDKSFSSSSSVASAISAIGSNAGDMTFEEAVQMLLNEEMRQKNEQERLGVVKHLGLGEVEIMAVEVKSTQKMTGSTSNGANGQKKVLMCYACDEEGHMKSACPHRPAIEASKQKLRDGGSSTPVLVNSVTVGATPINYTALRNREEYEHYL